MNNKFFITAFFILTVLGVFAQTKKDGTADMRYKANKQTQVNTYTVPSNTNTSVRYQKGYPKKNGTYVQPHYKTTTNSANADNFSTTPNTNPYTGQTGSRAKDYTPAARNYGSGKTIQTGSRGGQYYINSKGKKTYVPKR
jgi:hypothetical protein